MSGTHGEALVIRSLDEDAVMEVVKVLATNITDKDLQAISLLCISRLAISDLELAKYERKLIYMFLDKQVWLF